VFKLIITENPQIRLVDMRVGVKKGELSTSPKHPRKIKNPDAKNSAKNFVMYFITFFEAIF
jgi:hypothetical protein